MKKNSRVRVGLARLSGWLIITIIGSFLSAITDKIIEHFDLINLIKSTMPVWATLLLLPLLGISLYWVRTHFRLFYGITEFFVGFITALNVFLPTNFDYSKIQPLATLQILGGLYIMVRGLDNIAQSVRGTNMEPAWKKIFGV